MRALSLIPADGPLHVLCIGAHSDDIEIGCGGTVLKLIEQDPKLEFYWLCLCSNPQRAKEATASANHFLRGVKKKTIVVKDFRDGFLPYIGAPVKEAFEEIKHTFVPDLIFTHRREDLHQDHRMACELTWNTFRSHMILEYEIPKYDADLRSPNFFVPLTDKQAGKKVVIAAGDTFRAAAVEQLQVWGQRAGVPVLTAPDVAEVPPHSFSFSTTRTSA